MKRKTPPARSGGGGARDGGGGGGRRPDRPEGAAGRQFIYVPTAEERAREAAGEEVARPPPPPGMQPGGGGGGGGAPPGPPEPLPESFFDAAWENRMQGYRPLPEDPDADRLEKGPLGQWCKRPEYKDDLQQPTKSAACAPKIIGGCCVNSGTTSLAEYMNSHKNLTYGTKKEHQFFRLMQKPEDRLAPYLRDTMPELDEERMEVAVLDYRDRWHAVSLANASELFAPATYQQELPGGTRVVRQHLRTHLSGYVDQFPLGARNNPKQVRTFDFDPTYLWGLWGGAALRVAAATLGARHLRVVAALRDPAHQVCAKLAAKAGGGRGGGAAGGGGDHRVLGCVADLGEYMDFARPLAWVKEQGRCPPFLFHHLESYCYPNLVRRWFAELPREQFFFVRTEDLREVPSRRRVLEDLAVFLGVPPDGYADAAFAADHAGRKAKKDGAGAGAGRPHYTESEAYVSCRARLSAPGGRLARCAGELAELLGDPRWLGWFSEEAAAGEEVGGGAVEGEALEAQQRQ